MLDDREPIVHLSDIDFKQLHEIRGHLINIQFFLLLATIGIWMIFILLFCSVLSK